ncbi:transmembrane protein 198-B-like [Oscarella lobularis]|uniref:transmembrane protein 198-B-like n=1 Tax=Oscarella lobularis TaxID=121494 RepID=UPI0033137835
MIVPVIVAVTSSLLHLTRAFGCNETNPHGVDKAASKAETVVRDISNLLSANRSQNATCDVTQNTYDPSLCVAFAIFILLGIIFAFVGYRFFRLILFLTAFIGAFCIVFYFAYGHLPCDWPHPALIALGLGATAGLILGTFAACYLYLGIFLCGFALGAVAALSFLAYVHIKYVEEHSWLPIVIIIGLGIIGGIIALLIQRPLLIIATSVIGSYLMIMGLDYYVENGQAFAYSWELVSGHPHFPSCAATWVMLIAVPVIALVAIVIQWKCTAKGKDHKKVIKKSRKKEYIEMDSAGNNALLSDMD